MNLSIGAGKTYTMLGAHDEPGIMAQALNDLFLEMERTRDSMSYKVTMSYLEVREILFTTCHRMQPILCINEHPNCFRDFCYVFYCTSFRWIYCK